MYLIEEFNKAYTTFADNKGAETREFFDTIYGNTASGYCVLWTKSDKQSYCIDVNNKDGIIQTVEYLKPTHDCYFAVGLQRVIPESGRGKSDSVCAIPGLWCDLDIEGDGHQKKGLIPSFQHAMDFVYEQPLQPSMIVFTGGGVHCYWLFNEPWVFNNDNERQCASELSKQFQQSLIMKAGNYGWNMDNTSDLARLLRVAGTYNFKTGSPEKVYILEKNDYRYTPDDFQIFMTPQPAISTHFCQPAIIPALPSFSQEVHLEEKTDSDSNNRRVVNELINRCAFLKHCKDDAATLSEPEWHKMICLIAHEYGGSEIVHELSKPYPKYTKAETDNYILKALSNSNAPITCEAVKQTWNCNQSCNVTSPVHLKQQILKDFGLSADTESPSVDDDDFSDVDLLKERIPDVKFPWDSFPSILSECFKDLAKDMSVQPEMVAVAALGILSAAIGGSVQSVEAKKGYKAPINLWIIIIAESGDKKTPVMNRLMKPIHNIQQEKAVEYQKALQTWKQNQLQAKAVNQKQTPQTPEPKLVSIYTTDTTIEALAMMLYFNLKGIMLFQDEIAAFLLSFDKYRGGKGGDREQYLNLWNGNALKIDRASRETIYIAAPFLSILGGLQPRKAVRLFGDDSFDDGLISRFLFYRNQESSIDLSDYQWRTDYENLWTSMINNCYSMKGNYKFSLSDEAWAVFQSYDNALSRKSSYLPSIFKIFIPKSTNYVLRIAGILHLVEYYCNRQTFTTAISADTIRRAINLVNYFLSQSRKIMELYAPQKRMQLNMDARAVLSSVVAVSDTRNSFELPTNELYKIYNNQVPEQARLSSDVSFSKLLGKIFKEQKLNFTRKKLAIDGKTPQGIITDAGTINKIRELLKE